MKDKKEQDKEKLKEKMDKNEVMAFTWYHVWNLSRYLQR